MGFDKVNSDFINYFFLGKIAHLQSYKIILEITFTFWQKGKNISEKLKKPFL